MKKEDIIERYMRDTEHKANSLYNNGYKEGKNDGYALGREKGMKVVWDAIKAWFSVTHPFEETKQVFGINCFTDVVQELTSTEFVEKITEWEEGKEAEISAFDEVIDPNGMTAIVTQIGTHIHLLYSDNGKTWKAPRGTKLIKTGRYMETLGVMMEKE